MAGPDLRPGATVLHEQQCAPKQCVGGGPVRTHKLPRFGQLSRPRGHHQRHARLRENHFRVNVDQEVSDNFLIQTSVFYSRSSQGRFREQSGSPIFDLTRVPAGVDLLAEDPNFPGELAVAVNPTDALTGNPIYVLRNFKRTQWRGRLLGSSSIRYTPSRFLTLDANVSFDRLDNDIERIRPKGFRTVTPDAELNDGTFFKWRGGAGARR